LLLGIALLCTYFVTPTMSGLGFVEQSTGIVPEQMNTMHSVYWMIESVKLAGITVLFSRDFRLFR
jgi:hypothetical protein